MNCTFNSNMVPAREIHMDLRSLLRDVHRDWLLLDHLISDRLENPLQGRCSQDQTPRGTSPSIYTSTQ